MAIDDRDIGADAKALADMIDNYDAVGGDGCTSRGRRLVREYIEYLEADAPTREYTSSRGLLVDIGRHDPSGGTAPPKVSQLAREVGTVLATMKRGDLSPPLIGDLDVDVTVRVWSDGTPTTWTVEVKR